MAHELWAKGDAYEAYVGRWSRPVAARFLTWLAVPPGRRWLDVGCGTGALTGTILATATPAELTGIDPSIAFLTTAGSRLTLLPAASGPPSAATGPTGARTDPGTGADSAAASGLTSAGTGSGAGAGLCPVGAGAGSGARADSGSVVGAAGSRTGPEAASGAAQGAGPDTGPGARFVAGDARALPLRDAAVDVVVSGLALNFVPSPAAAVAEFARVTAPGGTVAAYVWDYADGMAMMRYFWEAATTLDPSAAALDEGRRMSICSPAALSALWSAAGLTAVTTRPIDTTAVFADFDDYWTPFLGGTGPAPSYVASLPTDHRDALRDLLRTRLPRAADGSIPLLARALAIRGTTI
ncbi:class I SAM-dependent methyltransferase [Dactylosporangium sp. NPDC000521]|uniref:class I SAM-dependent methyltransferase n=1 Tax=Dactylosporangium sp. NPDC000521 TaxID=3363975 RepID=UPI003680DA89